MAHMTSKLITELAALTALYEANILTRDYERRVQLRINAIIDQLYPEV